MHKELIKINKELRRIRNEMKSIKMLSTIGKITNKNARKKIKALMERAESLEELKFEYETEEYLKKHKLDKEI